MTATPTKPEELAVLRLVLSGMTPKAAGIKVGVHNTRLRFWCLKWAVRWGYDWTDSIDLGFFREGMKPAPQLGAPPMGPPR